MPTPGGGMVLHAYLIPAREADRQPTSAPIVAQANGRLAQHQRVATASWWPDPDFPRTSTLKVRRHLLPMPEAVHAVAIDSTLAADDPVGQAVATVAKVPAVKDAQTLGELGWTAWRCSISGWRWRTRPARRSASRIWRWT